MTAPASGQGNAGDPQSVFAALIERLEKATDPDRELDGLIYGHLNGLKRNGSTFILNIDGERFQFEHPTDRHPSGPAALYVHGYKVREFTESIDAAMTLVPEGYVWECGYSRHVPHNALVASSRAAHGYWSAEHDHSRAIAICIAALKARAASASLGSPAQSEPQTEAGMVQSNRESRGRVT